MPIELIQNTKKIPFYARTTLAMFSKNSRCLQPVNELEAKTEHFLGMLSTKGLICYFMEINKV